MKELGRIKGDTFTCVCGFQIVDFGSGSGDSLLMEIETPRRFRESGAVMFHYELGHGVKLDDVAYIVDGTVMGVQFKRRAK